MAEPSTVYMSYHRYILIALGLLSFLITSEAARADSPGIDGWQLHQQNRTDGAVDVEISKSSLRMLTPKSGLVLLANAPWTDLYLYCTKTGNIYKTSGSAFRNPYLRAMAIFDGHDKTNIPLALKGPSKELDLACMTYTEAPGFSAAQMKKRKNAAVSANAPVTLTYVLTEALHCDPQIGRIMARYYAVPERSGIPLQFYFIDTSSSKRLELSTSFCKHAKIKAADFRIPQGLTPVKDAMTVLVPDNKNGELDLMMMGQGKIK